MIHLVEHYLQRDILRRLSRSGALSFSELHPDGVNNGVFAYHLKALVAQGMVAHRKGSYGLSVDGIRYITQVSRTNLDIQLQPKIFGFLILENEHGEFVLHRRAAEPFRHRYTFPGGTLLFDETLEALMDRQLAEKVGIQTNLKDTGMASLRLSQNGHTLSHAYAHLFCGKINSSADLRAKDARFTPEWLDPHTMPKAELLPDILNILSAVQSSTHYFFLDINTAV